MSPTTSSASTGYRGCFTEATIEVRYDRGVFLPQFNLWLDPQKPVDFAFVSHAHFDHMGFHQRILASCLTCELIKKRFPGHGAELFPLEFGESQVLGNGDATVRLLPAGHVLGSAQLLLRWPEMNDSLVYTGDFKLREGTASEKAKVEPVNTVIMETTYGRPHYCFPPSDQVIEDIISFCREALAEDAVPVLLGYSLGKAQEILSRLTGAGLKPMLHKSVANITGVYEELGVKFPDYELFKADEVSGRVLICPPSVNRSKMLQKIRNRRVASVSGWAMDRNAIYRNQVDAAFPLSDHAGYDDLLRYVELAQPQRVLTLHGFAADFARDLRQRGYQAWSLTQTDQLEMELGLPDAKDAETAKANPEVADDDAILRSEFGRFAATCRALGLTGSKLKKSEILSGYLPTLSDDQLTLAATYLSGGPFPQIDAEPLNVGWAVARRAIVSASGLPEPEVRRISRTEADAGRTAYLALQGRTNPEPLTLAAANSFFRELRGARGPLAKGDLLRSMLQRLTGLEGECLIRLATGGFRMGLKEGLLEEAIAAAFERRLEAVKQAHMLLGDIGEVARLARHDQLEAAEVQVFRPVAVMLAGTANTAEELIERARKQQGGEIDQPEIWLQDKFDGIRAQLHHAAGRVEIYTRDLRPVTDTFAEIAEKARTQLRADVILDGEMLARAEGRQLSFFDLQKRLGRKEADLFLQDEVPLTYIVFDILWHNGTPLTKRPLSERLEILHSLSLPDSFQTAKMTSFVQADDIEKEFKAARARGNEGLMMKDPHSAYTPGRRGYSWMKLKKELATLDCVVVAAEQGHGKRSHVLSDYTFAVRDEETDQLVVIGKAYTGLTDLEIEELTEHFEKTTLKKTSRIRVVEPTIVLEIAFDSLNPSKRHNSGLAMRFPRIKSIRRDKAPQDADTLQLARKIAGN